MNPNTASQTITWTVYPDLANLSNPGDQTNNDSDTVSLALSASAAAGATLTFSATGLPTGLSLDASTGILSGTISSSADASSPYITTLTATDGSYSRSQTFTWYVSGVIGTRSRTAKATRFRCW